MMTEDREGNERRTAGSHTNKTLKREENMLPTRETGDQTLMPFLRMLIPSALCLSLSSSCRLRGKARDVVQNLMAILSLIVIVCVLLASTMKGCDSFGSHRMPSSQTSIHVHVSASSGEKDSCLAIHSILVMHDDLVQRETRLTCVSGV